MKEIRNFRDAGVSRTFWKRVAEFFTGAEDIRIVRPYGIFIDAGERLLVVDTALAQVHVMDLKDKTYSIIGKEGEQFFRTPIAIAGDDDNNVYITDAEAAIVYRYSFSTRTLRPFLGESLRRPTGIAYNRNNRLLYISDTTSHQIVVCDLKGRERFRIGKRGAGPGQFNYPTDLTFDRQGRLWVTDALNSRVQLFSAAGAFINAFGKAGDQVGEFAKPKGIATDSDGHIYVCDAQLDAVQVFDEKGTSLLSFGINGTAAGQFWMPSGLFIDAGDMIYVADTYNRRVQVFRYLRHEEPGETVRMKKGIVNE